jgi:hypothetical protein
MGTEGIIMYFKTIDVWQCVDQRSVERYRCFEVLPNNGYCVQSADFYRLPVDAKQVEQLDRQFLELLTEQPPNERTSTYSTLEEAILQHQKDFDERID